MSKPRSYEDKYQPPIGAAILAIPVAVVMVFGMITTATIADWGHPTIAAVVFALTVAFGVVAVAVIGYLILAPMLRYAIDSYRYFDSEQG